MPEAARIRMKLPDRLQAFPVCVLDHAIGGQLAAGPAMLPSVGIDPGPIVLQVLGRQTELAGRDSGTLGIVLSDDRDEHPVVLFADSDRPVLGDLRGNSILGRDEGFGGVHIARGVRATLHDHYVQQKNGHIFIIQ